MTADRRRRADPLAEPATPSVGAWNVANGLTAIRLLLVPIFVVILVTDGGTNASWRVAAFAVFVLASLTDRMDGDLARRRGVITDIGKIADPIADKALIGAALVGLSALGELPWWITVVILVREVGVTLLRFWVIRRVVIAASPGGKIKTGLQVFAIGLFILPLDGLGNDIAWLLMVAALLVTVATGIDYVIRASKLHRRSRAR